MWRNILCVVALSLHMQNALGAPPETKRPAASPSPVAGDLVIVERVEATGRAGEITMKIKGGKARADISSQVSMITDMDTGNAVTMSHDSRTFMRIPASTTQALVKEGTQTSVPALSAPRLQSTGRKARIGGYEAEEFLSDLGSVKMTYWIARSYPQSARILSQLARFQKGGLSGVTAQVAPGPTDFPGLPIRTEMTLNGQRTVTTLISVVETEIDPNEFAVPASYKELPAPALGPAGQ